MRKNIIKTTLEQYNVQVGDEFIVSCSASKFKLATPVKVLIYNNRESAWMECLGFGQILAKVVTGDVDIQVLPFVPEEGDTYYSYAIDSDNKWHIVPRVRGRDFMYYALQQAGCVFKDVSKAAFMLPQRFKELTGKDFIPTDTYEYEELIKEVTNEHT